MRPVVKAHPVWRSAKSTGLSVCLSVCQHKDSGYACSDEQEREALRAVLERPPEYWL